MYYKLKRVLLNMRFSTFKLLLFVSAVSLTMQACQPQDDSTFIEDTKPAPLAFTFKAKFGNTDWVGTQNVSLLVKNSSGAPSKQMRLSASSTDVRLFTISLDDASTGIAGDGVVVKTYTMPRTGSKDANFSLVNTATNIVYNGVYGSVVVTKCIAADKKISGTFSCMLQSSKDSILVTNGVFTDVPYDISEQ